MKVHFSSDRQTWETPKELFDTLNAAFHFTLDPCCEVETAKCARFYTKEDDGLAQSWASETVFMNPPYGRHQIEWVKKARRESEQGATVACLIPARTETRMAHEEIFPHASAICFVKGRIRFVGGESNAPFPSWIVVFGHANNQQLQTLGQLGHCIKIKGESTCQ